MFDDDDDVTDVEHDSITAQAFEELCLAVFQQREVIDERKKKLEPLVKEHEELKRQVFDHIESLGKDKHHTAFGTLSVRKTKTWTTPKTPEDKKAYSDYLEAQGVREEMMSVHSRTLNSHARAAYQNAMDEGDIAFNIPGLGEPKDFEQLILRRTK